MHWADLVESSFMRSFQHCPERLDPVDMSLLSDKFANRVLDRFVVVGQTGIRSGVVCIHFGFPIAIVRDKALQRWSISAFNSLSPNLFRCSIFDSCYRSFTDSTATCLQFLISVLVFLKTAKLSFIGFNRTVKTTI